MKPSVIYFGQNDMRDYKRGVENVICFQSDVCNGRPYYFHWGDKLEVYRYKSLICISLPHGSILKYLLMNLIVNRLGKQAILHSHNYLMSFFLLRKTDIFTVHDALVYQQVSNGCSTIKKWLLSIIERVVYRRAKRLHFISEFSKRQALYTDKHDKSVIIYNTTSISDKDIENVAKSDFTAVFPEFTPEKYCLAVRSIEHRARIDLLIELAAERQDLTILVAGKGPLLEYYRDEIAKRKLLNIKLLGYVSDSDLYLLYQQCLFVIVTAEYGEGFGLPIIEGYQFGKPVVASNVCAIPEVIIDNAYLFENNIIDIEKTIERTAHLCHEKFAEYYQSKFSKNVIYGQYKRLYEQVLIKK
jgi:glycosyltransferase involved in cell wall biosynthesis